MHHKLPVNVEELITFLKNEKNEAAKTVEKIGLGKLSKVEMSRDRLSILAHLSVNIKPEIVLRPYDVVYYGKSLGVVLNHTGNSLELIFDASKRLQEKDELMVSEPLILYDSALSIISDRAKDHGRHLRIFIDLQTQGYVSELKELGEKQQILNKYDLDKEKMQIVSEIISLPKLDYMVIEGPPGTGKTMTIAAAACEIAERGGNVLITSHTNVAVDNALERIVDLNPNLKDKVARIGHPAKISKKVKPLIERQTREETREEWLERLLKQKRIIGMTIAKLAVMDYAYGLQAVSEKLSKWPTFDYVFMDESSMIPLGIAIIPIYYSSRWIIVGDTKQLPPIIKTKHRYIGSWSIMELATASTPDKSRMLSVQRRGNSTIFELISRLFYGGALRHEERTSTSKLELRLKPTHSWVDEVLNPDHIISWLQIEDGIMDWCKIKRGKIEGASGVNTAEAAAGFKVYELLVRSGLEISEIAVITTYRAQANLIREAIKKANITKDEPIVASLYDGMKSEKSDETIEEDIERTDSASILDLRIAETVDSYQGREKPCIIYSLTNHMPHVALQDYRRINVAVTRAKSKLIIVSSLTTFHTLPWLMVIKNNSHIVNIRTSHIREEFEYINELNKYMCGR